MRQTPPAGGEGGRLDAGAAGLPEATASRHAAQAALWGASERPAPLEAPRAWERPAPSEAPRALMGLGARAQERPALMGRRRRPWQAAWGGAVGRGRRHFPPAVRRSASTSAPPSSVHSRVTW